MNGSSFAIIRDLIKHFDSRRIRQFILLIILMIFVSFIDILSVGSIFPFLSVLSSPERVFELHFLKPIIIFFNFTSPNELVLPITLLFSFLALLAGILRLLLLWSSTKLSFACGSDLSIKIYRYTLYQPYAVHFSRNSSAVINGISTKVKSVINTINMSFVIINSGVMLVFSFVGLLFINPYIVIIAFFGFGSIYLVVTFFTRKKLRRNSELIASESNQLIKALQEGLGSIRDIIINGSQEVYCKIYKKADFRFRDASGANLFITSSPRYILETFGILSISAVALALYKNGDPNLNAVPLLALLALSVQRLLPVMQQLYSSWAGIHGSYASLLDILNLLNKPPKFFSIKKSDKKLAFEKTITIKDLKFSYNPKSEYVLQNLNLKINKGDRIGLIGDTGSGKSTLLDLIMGLISPNAGKILIDKIPLTLKNYHLWQLNISHVPQSIFLTDSTIKENIAFGIPINLIDMNSVKEAAYKAEISKTIEMWPDGYNTIVGERGVRLSGGQRQRLGLARALYKKTNLIVLDEATSALDYKTEDLITQSIQKLDANITIIMISHRHESLKFCNKIIEIKDGRVFRIFSHKELMGNIKK